jgi:hypothetical protein
MTSIYVDPSAASAPDAADHLRHLVDTGHQVFLLDGSQSTVATDLGGVRSLLVGPRPAPSPRPTPRCDAEARDLASAVLEILSRDVMP